MKVPALALAFVLTLSAQQNQPASAGGEFNVTVKTVIAPTTVTNKDGQFIDGLKVDDFELYDNEKPQRITTDVVFQPISMVIAVEASSVVEDILPKIQRIGPELSELVLGKSGDAAVLCFDHRIQTLQDFTTDQTKVDAAFKKLRPGSTTHRLNDAAMAGIRMLMHQPENRRRVLVLISQSRDNGSEIGARDVLQAAQFQNVLIYSIDMSHLVSELTREPMPPRPDPIPAFARHSPTGTTMTPTEILQNRDNGNFIPLFVEIFKDVKGVFVDNPAELYTRYTGGRQYSFMKQEALDDAITNLGDELHSQYLLSYAPNDLSEAGFHTIRVVVKGRPGLRIRTRPGYWIAGGTQQ
jgi:VWFA-related protein